MGRILGKLILAGLAFAAGLTWGIMAEAAEAGVPLSSLLGL
ncbi:MAG: hypothetical protein R3265_17225 [Hyphomonas sp.]|nr:hypothetical protein [Hyphomonas sp.]